MNITHHTNTIEEEHGKTPTGDEELVIEEEPQAAAAEDEQDLE